MRIKHSYNLAYYKPKWWEVAILHFCRIQVSEKPDSIVYYKQFFNRLYICGYIRAYQTPVSAFDNAENN